MDPGLTKCAIVTELFVQYSPVVFGLTRMEELVLGMLVSALLVGWAVQAWLASHPRPQPVFSAVSLH